MLKSQSRIFDVASMNSDFDFHKLDTNKLGDTIGLKVKKGLNVYSVMVSCIFIIHYILFSRMNSNTYRGI